MKWTTLVVAALAIALGVAAFFLLRNPEAPQRPSLTLPSLQTDKPRPEDALGLENRKPPTKDPVGPANRIEIARQGQKTVLSKVDQDSWSLTAPVNAQADSYKVTTMLRAFEDELYSSFSTQASGDLAKYGLDEAQRIRITLFKDDQVLFDLLVGTVDKPDVEGGHPDTLVMLPDGDTVFRMKGKDLRSPFDLALEELRDKRVFDFAKDDVKRLELNDPRSGRQHLIVAEKKAPEAGSSPGAQPTWTVVKPIEYKLEGFDRLASDLAMLRATEFLPKLPGADSNALDNPYTITAIVSPEGGSERTVTLRIGAGRKAGIYAQVEGSHEFLMLSTTSADNLLKGVNDLRNKRLFPFSEPDVQSFELLNPGQQPISLKRAGSGWTFLSPAGETAYAPKVKSFVELIAGLNVAEYLEKAPSDQETGLGADARVVRLTLNDGKTITLTIGAEFQDAKKVEKHYIRIEGNPEVMTAMKYVIKNATKGLDDLRDRRVFRIEKDQIRKLTIKHPDQTLVLELSADTWNLTQPEKIEKVDLTATLNSISTLDVLDTVQGKKPEEVGLTKNAIELTLELKDGTSHSVTISEELKKDDHYASSSEPHLAGTILLLSKHKVQDLIKKLPDFKDKPAPAPMPGGAPMPM